VGAAIFLAHRQVWYDSTLLFFLENMLLFVPFILVTQAALIDPRIVQAMCVFGGIVAVLRSGSLKMFIGKLNFPNRLLGLGFVLLAVNVALPVIYRILHETKWGTKPTWGGAYEMNECAWILILPAAFALANLLPQANETGGLPPQRRWLPAGLFSLWITATSVHLYCLGYVYDFDLRHELLAPALWVIAWTAARRVRNIPAFQTLNWKRALMIPPILIAPLAVSDGGGKIFLAIAGLNAVIYAGHWFIERDNRLAQHLLFASVFMFIAGLPERWGNAIAPDFCRGNYLAAGVGAYFVFCLALSRSPKAGVIGSMIAGTASLIALGGKPNAGHWAVQCALVFLLLHSLRWNDFARQGAGAIRWLTGILWVSHSFVWMRSGGEQWMVCIAAAVVLGVYLAARCFRGSWGQVVVPAAAMLSMLSGPGNRGVDTLHSMPAGLLAVIGSFLLFGLGTLAALTKHRWHHNG
jgi:hypothetical protein